MDPEPLPPEPGRAPDWSARKYSLTDYTFQFITITAGVLIALLINGLVEWNANRNLVRDARANIALELAANKKEVEMADRHHAGSPEANRCRLVSGERLVGVSTHQRQFDPPELHDCRAVVGSVADGRAHGCS
jgi:hypothetical protein